MAGPVLGPRELTTRLRLAERGLDHELLLRVAGVQRKREGLPAPGSPSAILSWVKAVARLNAEAPVVPSLNEAMAMKTPLPQPPWPRRGW